MAKSVLILVLSSDFPPYEKMMETSLNTWDSVDVPGTETMFMCGRSKHKKDTDKVIYLPVENGLFDMGYKTIAMLEWALANKQFDYIARVNASCYVHKENLLAYVQNLPDTNVFAGAEAESQNGFQYLWGGAQYLISRDVVQKIVVNKHHWQHKYMEDESMSLLINWLSIPYSEGYSGAIDNMGDHWRCISYGGESITFTEFADLKRLNHHFIRVKQDGKRWLDKFVMEELFKVL